MTTIDITPLIENSNQSLTTGPPYNIVDDILKTLPNVVLSKTFPIVLNSNSSQMIGWTYGPGFCGEESFKQAGLYFGQCVSQYVVQQCDGGKELLIGVNDVKAAKNLHLDYKNFNYSNYKGLTKPQAIMKFFEDNLALYNFVIGTVYIYEKNGDSDYDHIVPVVGYFPASSTTKEMIAYQDLFLLSNRVLSGSNIIVSRKQAVKPIKRSDNALTYGFSDQGYEGVVSGVVDTNKETKRMILKTDCMIEPDPHLGQKPIIQNFSCVVFGLTVGKKYSILRFDAPLDVPNSNFINGKWTKQFTFVANFVNCEITKFDSGLTSGSFFYRVVELV